MEPAHQGYRDGGVPRCQRAVCGWAEGRSGGGKDGTTGLLLGYLLGALR